MDNNFYLIKKKEIQQLVDFLTKNTFFNQKNYTIESLIEFIQTLREEWLKEAYGTLGYGNLFYRNNLVLPFLNDEGIVYTNSATNLIVKNGILLLKSIGDHLNSIGNKDYPIVEVNGSSKDIFLNQIYFSHLGTNLIKGLGLKPIKEYNYFIKKENESNWTMPTSQEINQANANNQIIEINYNELPNFLDGQENYIYKMPSYPVIYGKIKNINNYFGYYNVNTNTFQTVYFKEWQNKLEKIKEVRGRFLFENNFQGEIIDKFILPTCLKQLGDYSTDIPFKKLKNNIYFLNPIPCKITGKVYGEYIGDAIKGYYPDFETQLKGENDFTSTSERYYKSWKEKTDYRLNYYQTWYCKGMEREILIIKDDNGEYKINSIKRTYEDGVTRILRYNSERDVIEEIDENNNYLRDFDETIDYKNLA